ncbi:hypothetical protein EP331_01840 [bacterium]|nr:MAG: hypothetical protein EP331_01840 [bacterium]
MKDCLKIIILSTYLTLVTNLLFAQHSNSVAVETGFVLVPGSYTNPTINVGTFFDPIYLSVGYQWHKKEYSTSIKLGLMDDYFPVDDSGLLLDEDVFLSRLSSVSTSNGRTLMLELSTSVNWLNNQHKMLPILEIGLHTLAYIDHEGGMTSMGDSQSEVQVNYQDVFERKINPFVIAGFQYKLLNKTSYAIPVRFGYRIPLFFDYRTTVFQIIDRNKNETRYELGRKSGFGSYFTIGLEFKL